MSDAEKMVIGAILRKNTLYDDLGLYPEDFTNVDYRRLYIAMSSLIEQGVTADLPTLYTDKRVGATLLSNFDDIPVGNAKHFADIIKEQTKKRQLVTLIKQIADSLKEQRESNDIITDIESEIYRIQERKDNEVKHIKGYMTIAQNEIDAVYANGGKIEGVLSGFIDLDNTLSGFQKQDLIVIAARTSIGKTAFALNMAEHMAIKGTRVVFFSCEMSPNQICKRLLSSIGRIPHKNILTGQIESYADAMYMAAEKMHHSQFYADFTPLIPFQELKSKCRIAVRNGCQIVFVDYLTLIKYGDSKMPRWERTGELVKELKTMARQLDIPVVVMSQLNRQAEGQKPTLAELRQSGEIEEHSDVILFLHRDRGSGDTELIVAKHRNGGTGSFPLYFNEQQVRFESGARK